MFSVARAVADLLLIRRRLTFPALEVLLVTMTTSKMTEGQEAYFNAVLVGAARLPWVRIDRDAYLRKSLGRYCSDAEIRRAIEESPAAAGISLEVLNKVADESIKYETAKVTMVSAAAGIPGWLAMAGTVPADMAQYFAHMLRIAQKLAYLYSWPDLFSGEDDDMDDATKAVFTLFVGVMFGVQAANQGVAKVAQMVAGQVVKKLPQRALMQGVIYPIVKKVAGYLGVQMSKQIFAKGVAKAVPVVGAVVSGGVTLASYLAMCKRLKNHLSSLELAKERSTDVPV